MNVRERLYRTLHFNQELDRLPVIEWAPIWNITEDRWKTEGLPSSVSGEKIKQLLGLDPLVRFRMSPFSSKDSIKIWDMDSYQAVRPQLYTKELLETYRQRAKDLAEQDTHGEIAINTAMDGFFWFPRVLFGIEEHLYSFYDYPEVLHAINADLSDFMLDVIDAITEYIHPVFWVFNEDMAYNHGPMLSKAHFDTFLRPYYDKVIAKLVQKDILPFIDCDGFVEDMIPWFEEAGIRGVMPLERQAGVDVVRIRKNHPNLCIVGSYNKLIMNCGETVMREEFERILPVMKQGGFIPSCDHQVPPSVSWEDYQLYLRLLREYAQKAVQK